MIPNANIVLLTSFVAYCAATALTQLASFEEEESLRHYFTVSGNAVNLFSLLCMSYFRKMKPSQELPTLLQEHGSPVPEFKHDTIPHPQSVQQPTVVADTSNYAPQVAGPSFEAHPQTPRHHSPRRESIIPIQVPAPSNSREFVFGGLTQSQQEHLMRSLQQQSSPRAAQKF